jgi:predicted RNase H-like nuclease (RuvC/YqgF family)
MKYIYFLVIPLLIFIGCTSSNSEQKNKEMMQLKRSLDSLKAINTSYDRTLDSLNANTKAKEDNLRMIQMQLDSLQKNMKETEGK